MVQVFFEIVLIRAQFWKEIRLHLMRTIIVKHQKSPSVFSKDILKQAALTILAGLFLFMVINLAALTISNMRSIGKVYTGVHLGGIDLSGLTLEQATDKLARNLLFPQTGKIVFEDGEKIWIASPFDLGLIINYETNAWSAYQHGRSGNIFRRISDRMRAWNGGVEIAPTMLYNEQMSYDYLSRIAEEINHPTVEASLKLEGVEVIAIPGQIGRNLDVSASLNNLRSQVRTLTDGVIPLVISENAPEIMDASTQAETARKILGEPFTLYIPDAQSNDPGPWKISPSQLAQMLVIERVSTSDTAEIQVGIGEEALSTYLSALAGDINQDPVNSRFIFNDDTRKLDLIEPATIGRKIEIDASIKAAQEALLSGSHAAPISLILTQPQVGDDATGEQLGITENIIATTSYFRGSTAERLQNIQVAAENFHGLLIPPGATFSMAGAMGNVSLDTGYAEALIIFGGRTINGVGGGVCQVSTTLFRAAFLAGYPIVERHPHAYRVGYYEQTAAGHDSDLAGLDATVFVPMVDFKFINDSPHWLLMETYYYPNSRSLTWKFYGTSDGRTVEWETSGLQNIVEPPDPIYEENPELANGETEQVDWAVEGADVTIVRYVYRDGQVILNDSFITHYLPWADTYQYGPGTNLKKAFGKKAVPTVNP